MKKMNNNNNIDSKILDYLEQQISYLKEKIFCSCGEKLTIDFQTKNLVCNKWLKQHASLCVSFFSSVKKQHDHTKWGTINDYYKYKIYKELLEKFKKV